MHKPNNTIGRILVARAIIHYLETHGAELMATSRGLRVLPPCHPSELITPEVRSAIYDFLPEIVGELQARDPEMDAQRLIGEALAILHGA